LFNYCPDFSIVILLYPIGSLIITTHFGGYMHFFYHCIRYENLKKCTFGVSYATRDSCYLSRDNCWMNYRHKPPLAFHHLLFTSIRNESEKYLTLWSHRVFAVLCVSFSCFHMQTLFAYLFLCYKFVLCYCFLKHRLLGHELRRRMS
jgi:hypothetical protein